MRRPGAKRRIGSLRAALKWLPFLFIPFAICFAEAWLRSQTQRNYDYEGPKIMQELGELERRIDKLHNEFRDKERWLERMDPARAEQEGLRLVKPDPERIYVIHVEPESWTEAARGHPALAAPALGAVAPGPWARPGAGKGQGRP